MTAKATTKRPVKKAKAKAKTKRGAIGARIRELIATRADLGPAQIAEAVRDEFPGARTTEGSVRCYFTYMRSDGAQPARDKTKK